MKTETIVAMLDDLELTDEQQRDLVAIALQIKKGEPPILPSAWPASPADDTDSDTADAMAKRSRTPRSRDATGLAARSTQVMQTRLHGATPNEVLEEFRHLNIFYPSDTADKIRRDVFRKQTKTYQFLGDDRWIYRRVKEYLARQAKGKKANGNGDHATP